MRIVQGILENQIPKYKSTDGDKLLTAVKNKINDVSNPFNGGTGVAAQRGLFLVLMKILQVWYTFRYLIH